MTPISPIEPAAKTAVGEPTVAAHERTELRDVAAEDVSPETVRSAIDSADREVVFGGRSIEFAYNEDVHRVVVTVRSKDTEEVVRQIPPEEFVRFVARFREMLGVMLDEVA